MIKFNKYIITLILVGTIMVPIVANAAVISKNQIYSIKASSRIHKPLQGEDKLQKIKEDYFQVFEKAEKYSPGIKLKGEELYNIRHELKKELRDKHRFKDEEIKTENEKTRKAYRDFVKAVESGDKTSIKKTFNVFEESSNNLNDLMRKKIKEIKTQ